MKAGKLDYEMEKRIAQHLASTCWDTVPAAAREQAVRAILWWLATGLEGVTEPGQAPLSKYVAMQGGRAEATILGTGQRTTAELAGLVNGRAGKSWEHEDKYWVDETIGFGVGCCVVPATLAASEARGNATGQEVVTAVALAIDLEVRLLRPVGLGFVLGRSAANATFVLGTYGAAAAAAKIFGLNEEGFLDTLGLAHCQASGNFQGQAEGRGVSLQAGIAVRNGIAAARLALIGMPGPRASLTGPVGLYAVHYPNSTIDFKDVVNGLGEDFLGVDLGFKGYPCGVVAHPAIDAVLAARHAVNGREIQAIDIAGPPSLGIMVNPIERKRAPSTATEAQFSIPWAAACAMRDGYFSVDHYTESAIQDTELQQLSAKVSVDMSDRNRGTVLRVTLTDGTIVEPPVVMASKGHPKNPLSTADIEELLLRAAKRLEVPNASIHRAVELMRGLHQVTDTGEIIRSLSRPPA